MDKSLFFHQIGKDDHYNVWHTTGRNMLILMHSDGGRIVFNNASYSIQSGLLCFVGGEKLHYTLPDAPMVLNFPTYYITITYTPVYPLFFIPNERHQKRIYELDNIFAFVYQKQM